MIISKGLEDVEEEIGGVWTKSSNLQLEKSRKAEKSRSGLWSSNFIMVYNKMLYVSKRGKGIFCIFLS